MQNDAILNGPKIDPDKLDQEVKFDPTSNHIQVVKKDPDLGSGDTPELNTDSELRDKNPELDTNIDSNNSNHGKSLGTKSEINKNVVLRKDSLLPISNQTGNNMSSILYHNDTRAKLFLIGNNSIESVMDSLGNQTADAVNSTNMTITTDLMKKDQVINQTTEVRKRDMTTSLSTIDGNKAITTPDSLSTVTSLVTSDVTTAETTPGIGK